MKRVLILIGVIFSLCLASVIVYAHTNDAETHSHGKYTCGWCHGKACPKATSSGVCNCNCFYRCKNEKCSLTVCDGCYYKHILPNLNKGCPDCKSSGQFKQIH